GVDTASYEGTAGNVVVNLTERTATGAAGDDRLVSIANVIGGDGNDRITGTANANMLAGGAGGDSLAGGDGKDTLFGDQGGDVLIGGAGDDVLNGGGGSDWASYQDTAAFVLVNLAAGTVSGGAGVDALVGIENALGGAGDDIVIGGGGNNKLAGGAGDDVLLGGGGNDSFIGGDGDDVLVASAGADRFRYNAVADGDQVATDATSRQTGDLVSGFSSAEDVFQFATAAFGGAPGPLGPAKFATIAVAYDGTNSGLSGDNVYVFDANPAGGGTLYYDADTLDPGYTVVATLDSGTVTAADIVLV
ncbi:MAG: calcium-binding protein, partial [Alphaproteobacteria bacterium]